MAFNFNNNQAAQQTNNGREKAVSFVNFYMPKAGGGRVKIGAIALYGRKPNDAALHNWLADNEGNVAKLAQLLQVEFREAGGEQATISFDQPQLPTAA